MAVLARGLAGENSDRTRPGEWPEALPVLQDTHIAGKAERIARQAVPDETRRRKDERRSCHRREEVTEAHAESRAPGGQGRDRRERDPRAENLLPRAPACVPACEEARLHDAERILDREIAASEDDFRMRVEDRAAERESIVRPLVVGVEERNQWAARLADAAVARCARACVRIRAEVADALAERPERFPCVVGRSVVDDDDLVAGRNGSQ